MKQKIEWYREVLELEPSSKVFFPLARLLAADGQLPEAISTLQTGVKRHPDHLESRLLLIELLFLQHDMSALHKQIHDLSKVLQKYPTFWTAWSEILATSPSTQDAALALRLFAMSLQGNAVSWATIMQRGMMSVLHETSEGSVMQSENSPVTGHVVRHTAIPVPTESDVNISDSHKLKAQQESRQGRTSSHEETSDQSHISQKTGQESTTSPKNVDESLKSYKENVVADAADDDEEGGQEEEFSLRTRSMAEVLAEQGDLAGALEIYRELEQQASPEDQAPLQQRIDELTAQLASANMQVADKKVEDTNKGRNRRLSLYTALEQRLAARGGE